MRRYFCERQGTPQPQHRADTLTFADEFWAKVEIRGENECWRWLGPKKGMGANGERYGTVKQGDHKRPAFQNHARNPV
jgi:hypothetical protein